MGVIKVLDIELALIRRKIYLEKDFLQILEMFENPIFFIRN